MEILPQIKQSIQKSKKKLNSLTTKDYNFYFGRNYFISNDGSKSTFVYQRILDTLELKKDKSTDYVINWKSKGLFNSKPLYTAFFNSIKLSEYKIRINFDKDPLAVEQNNYLIKIVIIYIVYDLDSWPRHLTNNFKFKNGLFGGSSIVKNCDKENYMYSEYGITLIVQVGGVLIMTLLNVVIFGVDNSS